MPNPPSPAAMRLAETLTCSSVEGASDQALALRESIVLGRAAKLDSAGIAEAVEHLEWILSDACYRAPETIDHLHKKYVNKVQLALSALNGTAAEAVEKPQHVCNLTGFDEMKGDKCPACEITETTE